MGKTFTDLASFWTPTTGQIVGASDLNYVSENARAAGEGPWTVQVIPHFTAVAQTNWSTVVANSNYAMGGYLESSGAVNAEVNWDLTLVPGTWSVYVLTRKSADAGIITVSFDATSKGTIDLYQATATNNVVTSLTGITSSTGGKQRVKFKMATKNGASSSYFGRLQLVTFVRTA